MNMAKKAEQTVVAAKEPAGIAHAKDLNDVLLVVIRIRGDVKKNVNVKRAMTLMRLHHKHHAALLWASPAINGMLFKGKDNIAYGIIDKETLVTLLKKKAKLTGRRPFDEMSVKNLTGYASYDALADALLKSSAFTPPAAASTRVSRFRSSKAASWATMAPRSTICS
jgi:ribosomal protein L30/L7E